MSMIRFYLFMGIAFILAMSLISVAHSVAISIVIITAIVAVVHLVRLKGSPNASRPNRKNSDNRFFRPERH